jgi:hypothetical protein
VASEGGALNENGQVMGQRTAIVGMTAVVRRVEMNWRACMGQS